MVSRKSCTRSRRPRTTTAARSPDSARRTRLLQPRSASAMLARATCSRPRARARQLARGARTSPPGRHAADARRSSSSCSRRHRRDRRWGSPSIPALALGPIVEHLHDDGTADDLHRKVDPRPMSSIRRRPPPRSPDRRRRSSTRAQARSASSPQPGDVRARLSARSPPSSAWRRCAGRGESPGVHPRVARGSGSPCCSPTSPRRWPKAAARRRRTRSCARARRRKSMARERLLDPADHDRPSRSCPRRAEGAVRARAHWAISFRRRRGEIVRASRPWTRARSRARARRSSARAAATSAVTGGTRVLSDWLVVRATADPGETFLDRMISMVEGGETPEDAERDRAQHSSRGADDRVPAPVTTLLPFDRSSRSRESRRRRSPSPCARRAARVPDPDDDRRPAVGDRHRRHGPHDRRRT